MAFSGFAPETFEFLGDLAEHNDRAWFAENRERYERWLLEPQREFVDAVGTVFSAVDARVTAVPAVDGSIYRIYRDTRFSADKTPYKTNADLIFWLGEARKTSPAGYWVRLAPEAVWAGGGAGAPTDEQLARYRAAVDDDECGRRLDDALRDLRAAGFELAEPSRKRVPTGFSATHPRAGLLRYTEVHATQRVSPPPPEAYTRDFVEWCVTRFLTVKPLVDWLAENLGGLVAPDERL